MANYTFSGAINNSFSSITTTLWYTYTTDPFNSTQPFPTGYTWTQLGSGQPIAQCNSRTDFGTLNVPITSGNLYFQWRNADGTLIYYARTSNSPAVFPPCTTENTLASGYTQNTGLSSSNGTLSSYIIDPSMTAAAPALTGVTPTPTVTLTNTPTLTQTPTVTATNTPTQSPAGVTATPTVTSTNTPTPSVTTTKTATPSVTPTNTLTPTKTTTPTVTATNTPTPSNTPGVCKTYQLYGGTGNSTFVGKDCNGFTFSFQVPAYQTFIQCATEVYVVDGNGSYLSIGSCPLPTPTPSITASVTPSVTATPTLTPTTTTTLTLTPTKTATNTPTPTLTQTQTQTGTAAVTPSPTTTKTPTLTPTNTATPSVTPTNTMTPTKTGTPPVTPTKTPTPTVTSTPTGTPPVTPTPTPTFFFTGFSADQQYAYTIDILGGFSGGTAPDGAIAPHPVFLDENGVPVQQLNGITLGGFQGLNN